MIIPVDKEKIIGEFKEKYVDGYFEQEYPKIQDSLKNGKDKVEEEIICKFKEVCNKAAIMQEEKLKNEIAFIYISYLRTSLMQNLGIYRIDLYDDKWFLDKEECSVEIDMSFIYEVLFNQEKELQEIRKKYNKNISEMDVEKIKLKEGDKYHKIGIRFFASIVNDLLECEEYKEMKRSEEISILAGEYRDEAVPIYKALKE